MIVLGDGCSRGTGLWCELVPASIVGLSERVCGDKVGVDER